ncbi:MAG: hypothetical protein SNH94_02215 [Rikenellaceae bacterium]
MNNKYDTFDQALRRKMEGASLPASDELWSRISTSMEGAPATVSTITLLWRWGAVAAAAVLVAVGANILFDGGVGMMQDSQALYYAQVPIDSFATLPSEPMALTQPSFELPRARIISKDVDSPKIEDSEPLEAAMQPSTPTVERPEIVEDATAATSAATSASSWSEEAIEDYTPRSRRSRNLKLALAVANGSAATNAVSVAIPNSLGYSDYTPISTLGVKHYAPLEEHHQIPISYALSIAYPLADSWSVESGLSYSRLTSDLTMSHTHQTLRQEVQFIGVPLRVNYKVYGSDNFLLYAAAAGQVERCVSAKLDSKSIDEKPWHFSTSAALGVQYNITSWLGLYAEPEAIYYLAPTRLATIRRDEPLNFNMRFGLRFSFGGND